MCQAAENPQTAASVQGPVATGLELFAAGDCARPRSARTPMPSNRATLLFVLSELVTLLASAPLTPL